jgi:hypothetical protein
MLSLPIFLTSLILVAICIFLINYYNETRCASDRTESELDMYSINVNKRLLQAESESLKNSIYIDEILTTLHSDIYQLEISKINNIISLSNNNNKNINDILSNAYSLPKYHLDSIYLDAEVLADKIDDIFKSINSDDELAKTIVSTVEAAEGTVQRGLEDMYANMNEETFRAMRRLMPITRTKMEWNVNAVRLNKNLRK